MRIKILGDGPGIAGYIKIGQPTPKGGPKRGAPEKFDHIEITTRARNKDGQLEPDYQMMDALVDAAKADGSSMTLCGGCDRSNELGYPDGLPTNLGVYLASDSPDIAFPNRLCWYRGRHAYCWGDGVEAQRRIEQKGKDGVTFGDPREYGPCGNDCIDLREGRCKPDARLRCSLAARELVGAVYEFRTTSWNSIRNIDSCLKQVLGVTHGTMSWVPLVFSLNEQVVQPRNGPANRAMVATLFFPGSARSLLEAAATVHQQMGEFGRQLLAARSTLPSGADAWQEAPEEVAGFAAEFSPDERDDDHPLDDGDEEPQAQPAARPAQEAAEDRPGEEITDEEEESPQGSEEEPAECGKKLPGGKVCVREAGHPGRHRTKPPRQKPQDEPSQEVASQDEEPTPTDEEAPPGDDLEAEATVTTDDRVNIEHEARLTSYQADQLRRLLREQKVASAGAAKEFLTKKLGREINTIGDLVELDFRVLCGEYDSALFDQLYQRELF